VLLDGRSPKSMRFRHYVRSRRKGAQPWQDSGLSVRLSFDNPVQGPLALGYASHFGLGLFAAEAT